MHASASTWFCPKCQRIMVELFMDSPKVCLSKLEERWKTPISVVGSTGTAAIGCVPHINITFYRLTHSHKEVKDFVQDPTTCKW